MGIFRWFLALALFVGMVGGVVMAGGGFTRTGTDALDDVPLKAPAIRVQNIYRWGLERVVIAYPDTRLIPIESGQSMLPMLGKGHKVLITTQTDNIQVGDFVVVENEQGRYFHQVIRIHENVYWTRGIANTEDDLLPASLDEIIGVAIAVVW